MQKLIIQPCSNTVARNNYNRTIQNQVQLKDIQDYLDEEQIESILKNFPNGELKMWGVVDGKRGQHHAKWENINIGDVAVFAWNNAVRSRAVVSDKLLSKEIAEKLWGDGNYRNIYLLSELENVEIPYPRLNALLGYDAGYIYQGFVVLTEEKSATVLEFFDLGKTSIVTDVSETEFENAINKIFSGSSLDRESVGNQRVEQSFLRRTLFGKNREAHCSICGKIFPIEFLVAAHIKRRADCSLNERKDFKNIVMSACKFGCDDLYEKGYILVKDGKFIINPKKWISPSIRAYLNDIEGRVCNKWSEATIKYFEAHNKKFLI